MQDRVVIITGGGTGIGRAAALQFAQAGASIVVVGRRATPLEGVASVSDRIVPIVADIQQEPDIRDIVHSTTKRVVTLSPSPDLRVPRAALNLKAGGVNGSTTLEAAERQRL
jgi:NAD(P)-dependent dehydrogenase (short-subunit alcohol dehydrogenase family)